MGGPIELYSGELVNNWRRSIACIDKIIDYQTNSIPLCNMNKKQSRIISPSSAGKETIQRSPSGQNNKLNDIRRGEKIINRI